MLGLSIQCVDCFPYTTPFSSAEPPEVASWTNPKKKREYNIQTPLKNWSGGTGDSALRQVEYLASKVAESTVAAEGRKKTKPDSKSAGRVYNNVKYNGRASKVQSSTILQPDAQEISQSSKQEEQVWTSLANLELDSKT